MPAISKDAHRLSEAAQAAGLRALTVLEGLYDLPDKAAGLQQAVALALEKAGFSVLTEARALQPLGHRTGRVDVVAEYQGGMIVIELDARSPRRKSVEKLKQFDAFRIIGLRGGDGGYLSDIDAIVSLDIDYRRSVHHQAV